MGVADAAEARMTLCILDGRKPALIRSAIEGETFEGTVVESKEE
jgi:hypothetical protein